MTPFLLSFYEKSFSVMPLFFIRFAGDLHLYITEALSPNRLLRSIVSGNYMSLLNAYVSLFQSFKLVIEYYTFSILYLHDLNRPL